MSTAAASTSQPSRGEGRAAAAPWRPRGLRLQPVPHCRLPTPAPLLQKYELGAQLGRGNFGTVWEARERSSGQTWAAKVVAKSSNKLKMLLLSREIQVLKMVEHPNIVYLREIFETPENVYLILELCKRGELATFCRQKGKITETDARDIIAGITDAIHYLHRHGIVHRDLKLENVLLAAPPITETDSDGATSDQPCAKLSDFGLAEVKDKRDHDHMMELFCGTPYCMAPEILSERAYSQQCDVWSMGVILYTLIAGNSPYLGGSERDVLYSIYRHPNLQSDPALDTVSAGARDLLSRMLHLDPAYRITASEVVAHPWIMDKCTQASASQDILTLMKEWRIEMTFTDDLSCDPQSADAASDQNHQLMTESGPPPPVRTPRLSASRGRRTSDPARAPRSGRRTPSRPDIAAAAADGPAAPCPRPATSGAARPRPAASGLGRVTEGAVRAQLPARRSGRGASSAQLLTEIRGRGRSKPASAANPVRPPASVRLVASLGKQQGSSVPEKLSPCVQRAAAGTADAVSSPGRRSARRSGLAMVAPPAAARERSERGS